MVIQGRELSPEDIGLIQRLLVEHPDWGRTRLSEELCSLWDWRNANGRIKDMAARTLLLKLERAVSFSCRRVAGPHPTPSEMPMRPGWSIRRPPSAARCVS